MGVSRDRVAPGLSEQQERVIYHEAGTLLVLGTPGTGRTEALARRLGRLVAAGERALVLTNSTAATNRIRARAEETIEAPFEELVVHPHAAAAARLLREHAT
jgi:superfamily I DNA/RNA helicase